MSLLAAPQIEPHLPEAEANPLAKLALLHAEAEETARLANLVGRSLHLALLLPALCLFTAALAQGVSLASQMVWGVFIAFATVALLRAYATAIAAPFERPVLKTFAKDMSAILLYAGFAWGAGAFLALPAGTSFAASIIFAVAPSLAVAILLREQEAAFLFLAPAAMLSAFAAVLKPFAGGALDAGLILLAAGAIAGAAVLAAQRRRLALSLPLT
jgi:hypothetical protein